MYIYQYFNFQWLDSNSSPLVCSSDSSVYLLCHSYSPHRRLFNKGGRTRLITSFSWNAPRLRERACVYLCKRERERKRGTKGLCCVLYGHRYIEIERVSVVVALFFNMKSWWAKFLKQHLFDVVTTTATTTTKKQNFRVRLLQFVYSSHLK